MSFHPSISDRISGGFPGRRWRATGGGLSLFGGFDRFGGRAGRDPFAIKPRQLVGEAGGAACNIFPPGWKREACLKISEAIGGGNGNGGGEDFAPQDAPTCIWPSRLDPVSGRCKTFVGSQEGPDPGRAVVGGFGLPAMVPDIVGSITRRDGSTGPIRRCMRTMVLGSDNLCYPKAVLPRRSKFRKWRGDVRPAVSAADVKAIRKAAAAKDRVLALAKDVGLHASKARPTSRPKAHQHLLAAPAKELRVISEHTN